MLPRTSPAAMTALLVLTWPRAIAAQQSATLSPSDTATAVVQQVSGPEGADRPVLQRRDSRYRLCASDVITLTFPLTPEFDQTDIVQPDGFVTLVGIGDIHVEGLTSRESADSVKAAYGKILHDPIVTVELKDFNKPYFVVSGQVSKPGKYDLRGATTATQAIAIAGGFNESAKHSQVLLFRHVNDDWFEVKSLDLKKILHGRDVNEDAAIHSGDMLFVPQNAFSKIKRFIPVTTLGTYYQP